MQGPFLGGFNFLASPRAPKLITVKIMANAVLSYQRHSFLLHQMIVQIEFLANLCLFERNLKALITFRLVIKPIHDFF